MTRRAAGARGGGGRGKARGSHRGQHRRALHLEHLRGDAPPDVRRDARARSDRERERLDVVRVRTLDRATRRRERTCEPTPRCAQYDVSTSRRRASSSRAWTSSAARRVSRSTSVSSTRRDAEAGGGGILAAPRARGRMTGRVVSRGRLAEANSPFGTTSDSHRTATARQPSRHYFKTGYSLLRETAGNLVGCADLDNEISLRTLYSSPESAATSPHTSRARHPHATEALPTADDWYGLRASRRCRTRALDSPPRDRRGRPRRAEKPRRSPPLRRCRRRTWRHLVLVSVPSPRHGARPHGRRPQTAPGQAPRPPTAVALPSPGRRTRSKVRAMRNTRASTRRRGASSPGPLSRAPR